MKIKDRVLNKSSWQRFFASLKFAKHCIVSPFDGFWDLSHEKRGTTGAATFILAAVLITNICKLMFTSFLVQPINWNYVNIFMTIAQVLLPFFVYILGNWCLTTLFEGKGTLKEIYMGTAYALTPYVLIQIPIMIMSNFTTLEEGAFYYYFDTFSLVWSAFLILASVMMIHDFSFGKATISIIFSLVAMLVIIFLLVLFFSLLSDSVSYFVSIYKEVIFRLY